MVRRKKRRLHRSTVPRYIHFAELKDCLASGWSAPATREYLERRYGTDGLPGVKAIIRWRNKEMPIAAIIPHRVIAEKLKGVEYKVDSLAHLSRLVVMMEDRVGRAIEAEHSFAGVPLPITDGVVRTYLETLGEFVDVAQKLGVLPAPPIGPAPVFDLRTQNLNFSNLTPEGLANLKETVNYIRRVKEDEKKQLALATIEVKDEG